MRLRFGLSAVALALLLVAPLQTVQASTSCPFSGGVIVRFDKTLFSNATFNAHWDVKSINLPKGHYKVSLSASDSYAQRDHTRPQPNEKYYVELRSGNNTVIAKSRSTKDLKDRVKTAVWTGVVNNDLYVSHDASSVIARHSAYIDTSSANSLRPVCVQFLPIKTESPIPSPAPIPLPPEQCPYSSGIVVHFDKRLLSHLSAADSYQDRSVSIPAGHYKVKLAASDASIGREQQSQPKEQFFVEFRNNGNDVVARSGKTKDLQDHRKTAMWEGTVNNDLTLSRAASIVRAQHAAYRDTSSPNSLNPICAQLLPIAQRVNGSCGSANGKGYDNAPQSNLCSSGTATSVSKSGNKWKWTCNGSNGGSAATCQANVKVTMLSGSCPFTAGGGDILVNFGQRLRADGSKDQAQKTVNATVPKGIYDVYLASFDGHSDRPGQSQPMEQYYIIAKSGSGATMLSTNATQDLQDGVVSAQWSGKVASDKAVSNVIKSIILKHPAYKNSNPNSVDAVCALFKKKGDFAACGNGAVETGEQCDDGNTTNYDGCSAQCKTETPAITIDKNDNDNGDDTQQVLYKGAAVYKVTVVNTGKVALTDVVVSDTVSPNCARTAAQTKSMYNGNTFDPGESFTYTCTETNVTTSHGSTASVVGKPVNHTANVSDSDSTSVTVKDAPAITIDKDDNDNKDDTQKVDEGGTATYTITVTNNGVSPLKDIVISDNKSPNCARSAAQTKALIGGNGILQPGKSFSYTCTETGVVTSHSTTASVVAKSTIGGQKVTDSDDTNVTVNNAPAISIDKNDNDNGDDTQVVEEGKKALFKITVKNIGKAALKDVVVSDALAPNCARSAAQTKTLYGADTFLPGKSFSYTCQAEAKVAYVNTATVKAKAVHGGTSIDATDNSTVQVKGKPPVKPEPQPSKPEPKEKDRDCKGSIGNTIWNDKNANGKQDAGEKGIPGVRVWLYKGNKVFKDTTNSRGRYKFKDLCSGTYRVVVKSEDISALYQTYDPDGKLDNRTKVRLRGDKDHHTKADFGYRGAVAPATGPGTVISIILAALTTGFILYFYRRRRMRSAA